MSAEQTDGAPLDNAQSSSERLTALSEKNTLDLHALERRQTHSETLPTPDAAQHGGAPEKSHDADTEKPAASQEPKKQGPPGGYDSTPVPHAPPGYRVKITFHQATALPIGDLVSLSSDPYLQAQLVTNLRSRHKEDPILRFRSRTLWSTTEPLWEEQWILEHIPASGFSLKVRIYDEDTGDQDDRLGNVHLDVGRIDENWQGIKNQPFKIKKRMGSKRAYLLRAIAVCMKQASEMSGHLYLSVEVLGRSPGDEGGRAYTTGLNYWCKHYSPLLGRIAGRKAGPDDDEDEIDQYEDDNQNGRTPVQRTKTDVATPVKKIPLASTLSKQKKPRKIKRAGHYSFQSNQMQLTGPVPPELYHRYVDFRPIITALFTASGLRGIILQKALHHQHAQVYNYNRDTKYGVYREGPCESMTEKFLDLCHHAEGGRIFTYVITLDSVLRFTETGKEFGIDLLSKHTMHSDADIYIAYSGEFMIRPRVSRRRPKASSASNDVDNAAGNEGGSPLIVDTSGRPRPRRHTSGGTPRDPSNYELIIDNESGTYRPNGSLMPILHAFLSRNLPGLKIITLDGMRDGELLKRLKAEQREHKRAEGGQRIIYTQLSSSGSSISSSDEEDLERRVEEQMLEERYHEGEAVGGGSARDEHEQRKSSGEPKHKLGEAVLPFISKKKIRDALMTHPEGGGPAKSAE